MSFCGEDGRIRYREMARATRDFLVSDNLRRMYSGQEEYSAEDAFKLFKDGIELAERHLGLRGRYGKLMVPDIIKGIFASPENRLYIELMKLMIRSKKMQGLGQGLPEMPAEVDGVFHDLHNSCFRASVRETLDYLEDCLQK